MTRVRIASESGIYHVTVHAVGREVLFRDEMDCKVYLTKLRGYLRDFQAMLYAWCLMGNHVHLLIKIESSAALSKMMQLLSANYTKYYNKRDNRKGTLVTGRFFSKPVDTEEYLLTVVRYIHQNPIAPRLSKTCDYRWSSYREYIGAFAPVLTSIDFVLGLFGGVGAFKAFHNEIHEPDGSLDPDKPKKLPYDEARKVAIEVLGEGEDELAKTNALPKEIRAARVVSLAERGLSYRQIAWLTGLSPATISRLVGRQN